MKELAMNRMERHLHNMHNSLQADGHQPRCKQGPVAWPWERLETARWVSNQPGCAGQGATASAALLKSFWRLFQSQGCDGEGVSGRQQGLLLVSGVQPVGPLPAHLGEWSRVNHSHPPLPELRHSWVLVSDYKLLITLTTGFGYGWREGALNMHSVRV